jgi:prophage tail gpP-like protein
MTLVPAIDVTLGSLRYDSHVSGLGATLALLPAVNSTRLRLPAAVRFEAEPGDDATVILSGGDEPAGGTQTILTGSIRSIRRTIHEIEVTCADGGADLGALRPATTYRNKSAGDVIEALASDAHVNLGDVDADLDLAAYVAHQGRTAGEHVAYLAGLAGSLATVNGDGELDVRPAPGSQAEVALLYGRELIEFERQAVPRATGRFAIGSGASGSASAPDALKPAPTRLPDDAASPGKSAVWIASPVLRTPKGATAATQALNDRNAGLANRMRARCFVLVHLRPGMVVEIQELPGSLAGTTWLLTRVTHRLDADGGGETVIEGVEAGASGGDLLGALLGALGSLL